MPMTSLHQFAEPPPERLFDDERVRKMRDGFKAELKKAVARGQAYYDGDVIVGIGDFVQRAQRLNEIIRTYDIHGSIPELVKLSIDYERGLTNWATSDVHDLSEVQPTDQMCLSFKVPRGCEPYGNDIRRFVDAMAYKLRKNSHKGRWQEMGLADALRRLRMEVEELEGAIREGNTVEIVLEAADVANFAMIAASMAVDGEK